jgi:hypothetical protein
VAQSSKAIEVEIPKPASSSDDPPCPICGVTQEPPVCVKVISKAMALRTLSAYFRQSFNEQSIGDFSQYRLFRCPLCTLEFADPPTPAASTFYAEMSRLSQYYPESRWEYGESIQFMMDHGGGKLLEIGCGEGAFLTRVLALDTIKAVGLDIIKPVTSKASHFCIGASWRSKESGHDVG